MDAVIQVIGVTWPIIGLLVIDMLDSLNLHQVTFGNVSKKRVAVVEPAKTRAYAKEIKTEMVIGRLILRV